MSAATVLTLSNGKGVDLLDVRAADIDFAAIAEHLAKEKRYNGATPDQEYSVADHLSIGSDAILADGGTQEEAAYFLLHDAHEALIKDLTTPLKAAVAEIAKEFFQAIPADVFNSFDVLEGRIDAPIYQAAGLTWPVPPEIKAKVKRYDLIMFVTEWRDLMFGQPHPNWAPYSGIKPLEKRIGPQPRWPLARAAWLLRANKLLPALRSTDAAELCGPTL